MLGDQAKLHHQDKFTVKRECEVIRLNVLKKKTALSKTRELLFNGPLFSLQFVEAVNIIMKEIEAELSYDYSYMKLVSSTSIPAAVLFGMSLAILSQKVAEPDLSAITQQKLGGTNCISIRWNQTRNRLS
jgi:hypothetical protein